MGLVGAGWSGSLEDVPESRGRRKVETMSCWGWAMAGCLGMGCFNDWYSYVSVML